MAAEDRDFEEDDPGDWDPPEWGDTWDLSDLSDDMSKFRIGPDGVEEHIDDGDEEDGEA